MTRSLEILEEMPFAGPVLGFLVGGLNIHHFTLTRFYLLHAMFIPLLMFVFFYLHFATVRRIGLSATARKRPPEPKPLFPDHLLNLLIILLLLFGAMLSLAVMAPTVFQGQADPFTSPSDIRPPWYLLPAYGLIEVLPSGAGGIVLLIALAVFVAVPFLDRTPDRPVLRRPLALFFLAATSVATLLLGYIGYSLRG